MKQEQGTLSSCFLSTNQSTRSRFVRALTKMVEVEGKFEERFAETVRQQFPVIHNGLFN